MPFLSSTCMVKPPTLPMPWIGGGGSAKVKASGTPCRPPFSLWEIVRTSSPGAFSRTSQSFRTTKATPALARLARLSRMEMPLTVTTRSTPGTPPAIFGDLLHHRVGALFRRPVGQLHGNDQVALVLDRQERGRDARQPVDGDADEREGEDDHERGAPRHRGDEPRVPVLDPPVDRVEAAREEVAPAVPPRRPQPQRRLRRLQRQRVDRADEGGRGDDERELPVELPGEPRQEGRRDEDRHQHQRDAEHRAGQVVHRPPRRLAAGQPALDVARRRPRR